MLSVIIPSRQPCKQCGLKESRIVKDLCMRCYQNIPERKAYKKKWRENNRPYMNKKFREYYAKNTEKMRQRARDYYKNNKDKERDKYRLSKYGVDGRELLEEQGGRCASCAIDVTKAFCIDHDHITGKIRGVLCNSCNLSLGYAKDSKEVLSGLIKYLEKYNG